MTIKVNENILSIPPYISTSWDQIATLYVSDSQLIVHLLDGTLLKIPHLSEDLIASIFHFHSQFLEIEGEMEDILPRFPGNEHMAKEIMEQIEGGVVKFSIGTWNGMGVPLGHDPENSDAPEIPKEILQKIAAITKIIVPESVDLPKPELKCNCFYCQVARSITNVIEHESHQKELEIQPEKWKIEPKENQLYVVTNALDSKEQYNVYLGESMGCTCGKSGCEHLIAVLKS